MRTRVKTVRTLEMTSPEQLNRSPPDPRLRFREIADGDPLLGRTYAEVGRPHRWSVANWQGYGSPPAKRHWLIEVEGRPGGVLTLLALPGDEVEILSFGLLPAFHGLGLGGPALTEAVGLAWTAYGSPVSRVWLHTNSFDHPRALANYQKRGFVVVETVRREVEVPDDVGVRVLITGMSGTGKSSVVKALAAQGLRAVDTDDGLCVPTPDGRQRWDEPAVQELLDTADNPYGKTPEQLSWILDDVEQVEPLLRRSATAVVDSNAPLGDVVKGLLAVVAGR